MCQLLGMNCNTPTDIHFSFKGFRRRGGDTDNHEDGFGIAFFEGKGVRIYHDDRPSAISPVADLIQSYHLKSENVISHIRKASKGEVSLANTHPFIREIWGEYWIFAHNGHLENHHSLLQNSIQHYYHPVGTTDSEAAFCYILDFLRKNFTKKPTEKILFETISQLTKKIRTNGIFNFLLTNGIWQIAHSNTLLHYIIRKAPFGKATLIDDDVTIDFSAVTTPNDCVAIIATLPLTTNEKWHQFAVNDLLMFKNGEIITTHSSENPIYLSIEDGLRRAAMVGAACL